MIKYDILEVVVLIGISIVIGLLFAFPAMWLWNWIMPMIFGLPKITFWQTVGLQLVVRCFMPTTIRTENK